MQSTSTAIRASGVSHRFGAKYVLHDVSFEVKEAEVFGFIGPNGAGKTTTIRALATLLEPTAGRIEIGGVDVGLEPERARPLLGYMADQPAIYPKLTVAESLAFFAAARRLRVAAAVDAALDLTGFASAKDELCGALSKGMRQRLELTKTLLHRPRVLILDEPASDLDPRARVELRDLLRRLRDANHTIFLSSHVLADLSEVCTSIGVIEGGRIVAQGSLAEIAGRFAGRAPTPEPATGPELVAKRIKIRVIGPADAAVAAATRAGQSVVRTHADRLVLSIQGGDRALAALVRCLIEAGIEVIGVEPERGELEAAFLDLTERDGR